MKRDFITLRTIAPEDLRRILDLAKVFKEKPVNFSTKLAGKELALIFQKTSTRTRASFEAAMHKLGGHVMYLDWRTTNFTIGSIGDEIKSLERYVDVIMARVNHHEDIVAIAKAARVPVINGLSDMAHPCQALGDMQTIEEHVTNPRSAKIVFIGDGANNVCTSLVEICAKLSVPVTVVAPDEYKPRRDLMDWLHLESLDHLLHVTSNVEDGVSGADIIYTDTHVSMGEENEARRKLELLKPYQLNDSVVRLSKKEPRIMHCLPAHREVEITSQVLDSKNSIVFNQAENRMHAQAGLLLDLLAP
nr:ornithine carbamoyltransferase [Candidatus Sigynarchaeota archaeon]